MLGDKLLDTLIYVIFALWITGFLLMSSLLVIRKFFPKFEEPLDYILLRSGKILLITMKISVLIAIILLAVWIISPI